MTDIKDTTLRGVNLLRNPWFNKSSAFTEKERDELGLRGLLPPRVSTFDEQVTRLKGIIDTKNLSTSTSFLKEHITPTNVCTLNCWFVISTSSFRLFTHRRSDRPVCSTATFSVMPAVFMFPVKTKAVFVSWSPTFRTKMSTSLSSRTVSAFSV